MYLYVCMYTCVHLSPPLLFLYSRNKMEARYETSHFALLRFLALTSEKLEQFCEYFFLKVFSVSAHVDSLVSDR